jgi:hypothetical protein
LGEKEKAAMEKFRGLLAEMETEKAVVIAQ